MWADFFAFGAFMLFLGVFSFGGGCVCFYICDKARKVKTEEE